MRKSTPLAATVLFVALVLIFVAKTAIAQKQSSEEQAAWKLEQAYWEYVKAVDLEQYRNLWHPSFVGWPSSSPEPVRKDHITDWITASTNKGLRLSSFTLERAASQATENVVVTHYWLTSLWADKEGHGEPQTIKVTHTWIRTPKGWQIMGGMAAPAAMPAGR